MEQQRSQTPRSFLSEHSAEYVLAPNIAKVLSAAYKAAIPLYYWTTREGASLAAAEMGGQNVRLVTAFARRPKVCKAEAKEILMKVNASLLQASTIACQLGSPVFAGVPLAAGLLQFNANTPCTWFHLGEPGTSNEDVYVRMDIEGNRLGGARDNSDLVKGPLTDKEMLNAVKSCTRAMPWDIAVRAMRDIRSFGNDGRWFMSGYRPFFLVIPE